MTDTITAFFDQWSEADGEARRAALTGLLAPEFLYADPRSPEAIDAVGPLNDYIGQFTQNAGWTARVVRSDATAGIVRALIAFGGPGPDGTEMVQHGTYFIETEGDRLTRIIGFKGTGAPE